jgi:hypothetical protein
MMQFEELDPMTRKIPRRHSAFTASALLVLPLPAFAACHNGVCASSVERGQYVYITLSSTSHPYTHFNFRNLTLGGNNQDELPAGRPTFWIYVGSKGDEVRRVRYSVQVCNRGGTFQRSGCRPWATFHHDVRRH